MPKARKKVVSGRGRAEKVGLDNRLTRLSEQARIVAENANTRMQSMTTRMEISSSQNAQNLPRRLQLAARTLRKPQTRQSRRRAPRQVQHGRKRTNLDLHLVRMLHQRPFRRRPEGSSLQVRRARLHQRPRADPSVLFKKCNHPHHTRQRMPNRIHITIAHQVLDFDQSL